MIKETSKRSKKTTDSSTSNKLSSGDLLTIKNYLKSAKDDFTKKNFQDCIEWCDYVLEVDSRNFFAMLLKGKCFNTLKEYTKAIEMYEQNIKMDEENVLGYKGEWEVFSNFFNINVDNNDALERFEELVCPFDIFFEFLHKFYMKNMAINDTLAANNIIIFLTDFKKKVPGCEATLLKKCLPNNDSSSFANTIGSRIYSKKDSLEKALQFELKQERLKKLKFKALNRLNTIKEEVAEAEYEIYRESPIESIYQGIINCLLEEEDSKEERFHLEEEFFNYKLEKVKAFPDNMKFEYFEKNILESLDNLMLIGEDEISSKMYQLHLDWMDFSSLKDGIRDIQQNILKYILKFPENNLSLLLLPVICSKHKIFDFNDQELELIKSKFDDEVLITEEDQCFGMIIDCTEKLQSSSLIAIRFAVNYLVLTKKYYEALPIIEKGINLCKSIYKDYGFNMINTKLSFSLDLALVYTHVDAPKYHSLALKLYDQYISEDPTNLRAKLGKAVIFAEREEFEDASKLINEYLEANPNSLTALEKYSYCQLQLGNYETSLKCMEKILANPELDAQFECDVRYQQSVLYLKKYDTEKEEGFENEEVNYLNLAYESLIKAIKIDEFYCKAFQQLGVLYSEYILDEVRAFKCYWKAFFLNNGDIKSAHYIVNKLCDEQEWKMAASICKDLVDSNLAKRQLQFENWPYRVLGIYNLDIGQIDQSIDWLQNSIRVNNTDKQSLVTLGQAYMESGKAEAALRVFLRVTELYPDYDYGKFFYAIILSKLGSFVDAEKIFNDLCFEDETVEFKNCYLIEYISHLAEYSVFLNGQGFISKSCNKSGKLIECVQICIQDLNCSHYNSIWTSLNVALKIFLATGSKHNELPIETLIDIFESADLLNKEIDILKDHPVTLLDLANEEDDDPVSIICKCLILASKCTFITTDYEKLARAIKASLWYNLATSELISFIATSNTEYRDWAILDYKQSIKLQSNVAESWSGLGMATMDINFKVSQHCLIKALSISPKEPLIYNNLALLALKNKDTSFANLLFQKSQSLFPINFFSWFGLALSNEIDGNEDVAAKYFKHSLILSQNKNDFVAVYYAMAVLKENFIFKKAAEQNFTVKLQEFIFTIRSLEVYLKKKPDDTIAIESLLILLERVNQSFTALPYIEKLIASYEEQLKDDMNNNLVFSVCRLKAQYARILLSQGEFSKSIDEGNSCNEIAEFADGTSKEVKISNDVVIALASYFKGENKKALDMLSNYNFGSVMELTYKIMFNSGLDIKFDHWNNSSLLKIFTALSLVKKDTTNITELIVQLNKNVRVSDPDLIELLTTINKRLKKNETHLLQRSLFMDPNNLTTWEIVDPKLAFRLMDSKPLQVHNDDSKSEILIRTQQLSKIQRAMFLTPWKVEAVSAFKQCYI